MISHMLNIKYCTNEAIYIQNRNKLTDIEIRQWLPRGRWGGRGMDWEFGVGRGKLLHLDG